MLRVIVEVVFSNDRVAKIKVREGDSPKRLAAEFLERHSLPAEYEAMLTSQIEKACGGGREKGKEKKKKKLSSSERQAARSRLYGSSQKKEEEECRPEPPAKNSRAAPKRSEQTSSCERLHREGVDLHRRFEAMKTLLEMEELAQLKDYKVSEASRKLVPSSARRASAKKSVPAEKAATKEDDEWTCPLCGFSNPGNATTCTRLAKFKETPLAEKCPSAWAVSRKLEGATACGEPRPLRPHEPTIVSAKSRQLIEAWRRGAERYEWQRNRDRHRHRRDEEHFTFKPTINQESEAIVGERRVVEALKEVLEEDATAETVAETAYAAALAAAHAGFSSSSSSPLPSADVHERLYAAGTSGLDHEEACRRSAIIPRDGETSSRNSAVDVRRQRTVTNRLHGEWRERRERSDRARRAALAEEESRREASTILRQSCWPREYKKDRVHDTLFEEGREKDARRAYLEARKVRENMEQSTFKAGEESKRLLEERRRRCLEDVFDQLVAFCAPEELSLEDLASEPVISRKKGAVEACARLTCSDDLRKQTMKALSQHSRDELDRQSFLRAMADVVVAFEPAKARKKPLPSSEAEEPLPSFTPTLETSDARYRTRQRHNKGKVEDVLRSYSATYAARRRDLEKALRCEADKELTFQPKITAKARRRHRHQEYPLTRKVFSGAASARAPPQTLFEDDGQVSFTEASDLTLYDTMSPRAQAPTPTETRTWRESDVDTPMVSSDDSVSSSGRDDNSTLNVYAAAYHGSTRTLGVGEI